MPLHHLGTIPALVGLLLVGPAPVAVAQLPAPLEPVLPSGATDECPTQMLRLQASARALAMGNAGIAGRDDDVIFYGPAQLATARGVSVSGEHFDASTSGVALSAVTRLASGGIGVGANALLGSDTPPCGGAAMGTSATEVVAGVAQTWKRFHVGLAGRFDVEQVGGARQGRLFADVGLSRDLRAFGGATMPVVLGVRNIPLGGGDFDLPHGVLQRRTAVSFGTAVAGPVLTMLDVGLAASIDVDRHGIVVPAGGVEAGYVWLDGYGLYARVGGRRPVLDERPLTAGLGLTLDRLSVDYALETMTGGRIGHRVGARVR